MIRKLNVPTAILLIACLTLAPTALAADHASRSWLTDLVQTVKAWVMGGEHFRESPRFERQETSKPNPTTLKCGGGGGEGGPQIDPSSPGCGG